ncbi:hypothetical protein TQ29_13725 [Actibacterium sp. EMB200-NS6]|nr:hypothetical protein TQ29_13725 [Actibacterium sp. EMB200-NS6]
MSLRDIAVERLFRRSSVLVSAFGLWLLRLSLGLLFVLRLGRTLVDAGGKIPWQVMPQRRRPIRLSPITLTNPENSLTV